MFVRHARISVELHWPLAAESPQSPGISNKAAGIRKVAIAWPSMLEQRE
jgi:hypothetical protein